MADKNGSNRILAITTGTKNGRTDKKDEFIARPANEDTLHSAAHTNPQFLNNFLAQKWRKIICIGKEKKVMCNVEHNL